MKALILDLGLCPLFGNTCSPYAICVETLGTYRCECYPGFTGNGSLACNGKFYLHDQSKVDIQYSIS